MEKAAPKRRIVHGKFAEELWAVKTLHVLMS
jgi:hypothetical protein